MNKREEKGMIYIFSGEGKGKTSAALGVAARMLLNLKKVVWISWFKDERWRVSEMKLTEKFRDSLKMYWMGSGFYIPKGDEVVVESKRIKVAKVNTSRVYDTDTPDGHIEAARRALILSSKILSGGDGGGGMHADLLVMDEVVQAIGDGLLEENEVIQVLKGRGKTHVVLTGRGVSDRMVEIADLVTEMKKIKHPFDAGKLAVKGLDF